MPNDELVMYIIVNSDLKMSKGKLAAQVAHSAVKAYKLGMGNDATLIDTLKWYRHPYTKIILKATEKEMRYLQTIYLDIIVSTIDEGRTEIKKGSLTTMAFVPLHKSDRPDELNNLKLL